MSLGSIPGIKKKRIMFVDAKNIIHRIIRETKNIEIQLSKYF